MPELSDLVTKTGDALDLIKGEMSKLLPGEFTNDDVIFYL